VFAETLPDAEDSAAAQKAEDDGIGGTEDDAGDGTQGVPLPGLRNRQQTRDVARLTRLVYHRFPHSPYTLLIEDDFVLCDGALAKLGGLVAPDSGIEMDWTAIRVSYGLCGVMMQRKDMLAFANYLLEMQFFRPVDILAYPLHSTNAVLLLLFLRCPFHEASASRAGTTGSPESQASGSRSPSLTLGAIARISTTGTTC
jgi:hypothetical protein